MMLSATIDKLKEESRELYKNSAAWKKRNQDAGDGPKGGGSGKGRKEGSTGGSVLGDGPRGRPSSHDRSPKTTAPSRDEKQRGTKPKPGDDTSKSKSKPGSEESSSTSKPKDIPTKDSTVVKTKSMPVGSIKNARNNLKILRETEMTRKAQAIEQHSDNSATVYMLCDTRQTVSDLPIESHHGYCIHGSYVPLAA